MFLTLTFHWCVVSCKSYWKKSGDFNFSNTLHSGSRNPSPFFHVLRPRPQPRHRLGLNHWEAHVYLRYLKGYKDGVGSSESTSSSNPNYQILHAWSLTANLPLKKWWLEDDGLSYWGFGNFSGANSLLNFGGVPRLLISTDHCSSDHQVRAKHQSIQSVAESNTASQGNLLWWCHPCGLQFPEMWSGNLWCPNLPQTEQLEFENYQQNLFFAKASFSSCHVWWNNV